MALVALLKEIQALEKIRYNIQRRIGSRSKAKESSASAAILNEPDSLSEENAMEFGANLNTLMNNTNASRFLCSDATTKRIYAEKAKLLRLSPSSEVIASGGFGEVLSAVAEFKGRSGRPFSCLAAYKRSKQGINPSVGIPYDVLLEMSTFARVSAIQNCSKGLFCKLMPSSIQFIQEHYVSDILGIYNDHIRHISNLGEVLFLKEKTRFIKAFGFQVLHGLAAFHAQGMIHRDIKSLNLFVCHDGKVVLGDYGLSSYVPVSTDTKEGAYWIIGTEKYYAPEFKANPIGINSKIDIWALGVTFLQMLTANESYFKPYDGAYKDLRNYENGIQDIESILFDMTDTLETMNPGDLSNREFFLLGELIKKCIEIDPAKRFSAEQLLAHPFFKGMTHEAAKQFFIDEMSGHAAWRRSGAAPGTLHLPATRQKNTLTQKIQKIRNRTRRNVLQSNNAEVSSFFRIEPAPSKLWRSWPGFFDREESTENRANLITYTLFLYLDDRIKLPLLNSLHAIELFERVCIAMEQEWKKPLAQRSAIALRPFKTVEDYSRIFAGCILLADKLSRIGVSEHKKQTVNSFLDVIGRSRHEATLGAVELEIVVLLHGDLFPLRLGLVDRCVAELVREPIDGPQYLLFLLLYICSDPQKGDIRSIFDLTRHVWKLYRGESSDLSAEDKRSLRRVQTTYLNLVQTTGILSELLFYGPAAERAASALGIPLARIHEIEFYRYLSESIVTESLSKIKTHLQKTWKIPQVPAA